MPLNLFSTILATKLSKYNNSGMFPVLLSFLMLGNLITCFQILGVMRNSLLHELGFEFCTAEELVLHNRKS